ncbi:MAG TPA: YitT family protein [Parachlamydiales bacterium]|nr:YitT family protein [Parachlamydiales bacterium]
MAQTQTIRQKLLHYAASFSGMAVGAFFAALALRIFFIPNELIDGGVLGISMILARLSHHSYLSLYLLVLNIPFVYLAYRYIRRSFVIHMLVAILLFAFFLSALEYLPPFGADPLEAIVIGGAMLGAGAGLIIRYGGCTDGTEILAILINRKKGFTVGQVILFINIFIFAAYGWIFDNWHTALRSLMTYIVAFKMMDIVIAGLEELKSVLIMCAKPDKLSKIITHELGLGLTFIKGKGGYSGEDRDILFIIVERLDLAELKEIVLREDPTAFIAIENLHEVAYGRTAKIALKRKSRKGFVKGWL